jgi:hypothetical protein
MNPPVLARALLLAVAGDEEAEFVAGDLQEEFALLCASRGRPAGMRWYWRQVVRSAMTLLALRMRSGELTHVLMASVVAGALPLLALDRLWCFVYSQIPLKDGPERAPIFLAANLLCVCFCAAIGGSTARTIQQAAAIAFTSLAAAAFAMWAAVGAAPAVYVIAGLLGVPASSLVLFKWRKST